jgi:hypothetical protein
MRVVHHSPSRLVRRDANGIELIDAASSTIKAASGQMMTLFLGEGVKSPAWSRK